MSNQIDLNQINNKAKKKNRKYHSPKVKPSKQENLTDVEKKKLQEYHRTNRSMGIDQETHDLLLTWQAILSNDNKTLSFKNVVKELSATYLDSLSTQKKNKFKRIRTDVLDKDKNKNPYQL